MITNETYVKLVTEKEVSEGVGKPIYKQAHPGCGKQGQRS